MLIAHARQASFIELMSRVRSARTCFKNYQRAWEAAKRALTNTVPDPVFISRSGKLTTSHSIGGVFYLSEGELKSSVIEAMNRISGSFPTNTLLRTPYDRLHITGLVFRDIRPTPFSPEEVEQSMPWVNATETLCAGMAPPVFSVFGINLTKMGVIYGKAYPHTDGFQTVRDRLQASFPESRHKDVYNLSLGRVYQELRPEEYGRALCFIEENYLHTYLGTFEAKTLSINHHDGLGLIAQGRTLSEVNF